MDALRDEVLALFRTDNHAALATLHADGAPQVAVVGMALNDALDIVFDTLASSRKLPNVRRDGRVAIAVWHGTKTVQLEGVARELSGPALARAKAMYFATFPDGPTREAWPGITWVLVRPTWARLSDFSSDPPRIVELPLAGLVSRVDPGAVAGSAGHP